MFFGLGIQMGAPSHHFGMVDSTFPMLEPGANSRLDDFGSLMIPLPMNLPLWTIVFLLFLGVDRLIRRKVGYEITWSGV